MMMSRANGSEGVRNRTLLGAASGLALLCGASAACAQAADGQAQGQQAQAIGEIVVTASRINQAGFTAPTPTTVISTQAIQQVAQPNVFNVVAQLPALQGSTGVTAQSQNGGTSLGTNGLSALNMRGLGSIRTLTLIDGQRVVAGNVTGIADVSQFPQLLIQRVDVVTGGASASWGSDAVAGVVNFITEKHYEGIKANLQAGESTYGDSQQILAQVAVGRSFLNDKLHAEASAEYFNGEGVGANYFGGASPNGRPTVYRSGNTSFALAATPAGAPQNYFYPRDAQDISYGAYGLITAGPLQGLAFGQKGALYTFQYGGSGVPVRGSSPAVVGCVSTICQGGDQSNYYITTTVEDPLRRSAGYVRMAYDLTPKVEVYSTLSLSDVITKDQPLAAPRKPGLTIQCSNPLLPAQVVSYCNNPQLYNSANSTTKITSFTFGTEDQDFPAFQLIKTDRQLRRFVVGTDGSFDLLGKPVNFDAYYQRGESYVSIDISNMTLTPRYNAAIGAVLTNGQITCGGGAAAISNGCIPWNVFGLNQNSPAAFTYMAPLYGPYQHTLLKEDAAGISFNATPFRNWAGDISVATGAEYRKEFYKVGADPYGNGTATPYSAKYPFDALLSATGNNWFAGNYHSGRGEYQVWEAFLEFGVPLWDLQGWGKANLNVAGRWTDYSTSGQVETWKAGGTWDTPLDGFRIRGVRSRDIRAPNLSELYAAPQTATQTVINRANGANTQFVAQTVGNPNLKPEIADNSEIGGVYRPKFLPGLSLSVDYFDIKVRQAISTLLPQQEEDLCFNGNQTFCSAVSLTGTIGSAVYPYINVQPFNLASISTSGLDFEASYRINLSRWKLPGTLDLRALATRSLNYKNDSGITGQIIAQRTGNNAGDIPYWKANITQTWSNGPLRLNVTERVISDGLINPDAIECQAPNCPVPTVQHPTTNFNRIPGAVYLDLGGSYQWNKSTQFYFKVDNAANVRAPPFGSTTIYDVIGRMFRIGVRFEH